MSLLSSLQRRSLLWIGLVSLGLVTVGCRGSQTQSSDVEQSHIKVLAIYYGQYTGRHRGQPPASEEAFREYVESRNSDRVEAIGGIDQMFISERDQKPYVVHYGKDVQKHNGVVAYEQVGSGGKRYMADDLGVIEELDEEQFGARVPGAK